MQRTATAVWNGGLKDGKGSITTQSGVLSESPYSFVTRFENQKGTNPEELIAAAHAGCFTMALSAQLGTINVTPQSLRTTATVTLEKLDAAAADSPSQLFHAGIDDHQEDRPRREEPPRLRERDRACRDRLRRHAVRDVD